MESIRSGPKPAALVPQLEDLHVAVIGAGAIGAEVIRSLVLAGLDGIDVYEVDARRADAWRGRHTVYQGDFWDELTLARLRNYDFAFCTVDDRQARERANHKCLIANVNLVQAWTDGTLVLVGVHPFGTLADCACHECACAQDAQPLPLASLKLTVAEPLDLPADSTRATTASVAGVLAASMMVRVVSGTYGSVARRAVLDSGSGQGSTVELRRDAHCPRCHGLQRPVPIVHTRNRWSVSSELASYSPATLDQPVELSDAIAGLEGHRFRVGELADRFHGGPVPAKFALTVIGGRAICLDFEDVRGDSARAAPAARAVDRTVG